MASTYNPYDDIQKVYNAKVAWNQATTDAERNKQNKIATTARKNLEAYGYGDVANQISASGADATAARKIMEKYSPVAPDSTSLSNDELITVNNNETRNKINKLWGTQESDREMMTGKYNKLENTAYSNPFESDEAKSILAKYDMSALNARDNAVASGGASNGGNIDSYAAANALRQQSALINQGQMAVLDAHNNKINNVKGILSDLGVYLQNQDKGMQTTIGLQSNEGQRLFENEETAKNNETARLVEQANVTGYTPNEWVIKNNDTFNQFLNPDGTFKKEMEGVDIQALINQAKASGNTKLVNDLAVVRARKMLGNYSEFGKYMNEGDVSFMTPQQTEAGRQFDVQSAISRETLATEKDINDANNQNTLDQLNLASQNGNLEIDENGKIVVKQEEKDKNDGDGEETNPIYTTWETAGISFQTFKITAFDQSRADECNVDEFGTKAIRSVIEAVANGTLGNKQGIVSNYDVADYLIRQSNNNDTNKNQLKKVFAYFGLNNKMLNYVKNVSGAGDNWRYGVDYTE